MNLDINDMFWGTVFLLVAVFLFWVLHTSATRTQTLSNECKAKGGEPIYSQGIVRACIRKDVVIDAEG